MIQVYRDPHYIENFTIYGERHTGTKFLEKTISQTFNLHITYFFGFKHWMGFANHNSIKYNRQTLFFGIVRHPYEWLTSFYNNPHHVPKHNRNNFENFLLNEWYSIDNNKKEIMYDRNFNTKPNLVRYQNIFEMRKNKLIYLSETMPKVAKNYILLTYEYLINYQDQFIDIVSDRFNLLKKNNPPPAINKSEILLNFNQKNIIDSKIDWSKEYIFGYRPRTI